MIKNYIKLAVRNILKYRTISLINISGLSIAFGCSVVVFLFLQFAYSINGFHENRDRIFMIENLIDRSGNKQWWADAPEALAPSLKNDFPQVTAFSRVQRKSGAFRYGETVIDERITFVDPDFLDMFTFPLLEGNTSGLREKSSVYLTEEMAEKFFGEENPVGKAVSINFGKEDILDFKVAGVLKSINKKSGFRFNFLVNYDIFLDLEDRSRGDWNRIITAAFIMVDKPESIEILQKEKGKYLALQNQANDDWTMQDFDYEPLMQTSKNQDVFGNIMMGPHPAGMLTILIIGVFLLSLACLNYINVALGSANNRLKEIGLRKVIGGMRSTLIAQFMTENVIIAFMALLLGIVLAEFFLVPGFNSLLPVELAAEYDLTFFLFALGVLALTAFASGAYPALYVSGFNATEIFRGKVKFGGKKRFSRVLLGFQFLLSFLTFSLGVVFIMNNMYLQKRDWGYNQELIITIPLKNADQYAYLKDQISQQTSVVNLCGTKTHFSRNSALDAITANDRKYEVEKFLVGYDYAELMELRLKEGRFFRRESESDLNEAVVINELLAKSLDWDDPIGQRLVSDSATYYVIGVVEDFHYNDFFNEIRPVVLRMTEETNYEYLVARVAPGTGVTSKEAFEDIWKSEYPDLPFKGFFQSDVFDGYFQEMSSNWKITLFTSMMALILSCMGLFGLIKLNVARKMKEYSIRKVLGAELGQIIKLINRDFIWILVISMGIAAVISYFLVSALFDSVFPYHMQLTILPFIFTALILLVTALLTVSSQIYKVARHNPVQSLKDE